MLLDRLPLPSSGALANPGIKPRSPALQANSLPSEPPGKPNEYLGELSSREEPNTRKQKESGATGTYRYSTQHSPPLSLMNTLMNPQSEGLFTSVSITWYDMTSFQQKITRHTKKEEETKQSSELGSGMIEFVEIINMRTWNSYYYIPRVQLGKVDMVQETIEVLRKSQKETH